MNLSALNCLIELLIYNTEIQLSKKATKKKIIISHKILNLIFLWLFYNVRLIIIYITYRPRLEVACCIKWLV